MRVTVFATNFSLSDTLRQYAELKVWLGVQRATNARAWTSVRLTRESGADQVSCQMDLWLKRTGFITVTHTDWSAEAAVDRAAVRLEQALRRKLESTANQQAGMLRRIGARRAVTRLPTPFRGRTTRIR